MGTSASKDCGLVSFCMQKAFDAGGGGARLLTSIQTVLDTWKLLAGLHSYKQWTLRASRLL